MIHLKRYLLIILVCMMMPNTVYGKTLSNIKDAYFKRDYSKVEKILEKLKRENNQDIEVETAARFFAIAINIKRNNDDAQDLLEGFLQENPADAESHYMAGLLWYEIAKRVSIFSKMSSYKKYVKLMVKASVLAPENERYQMEAAKAFGQPSMMGGDSEQQKPIVDKLLTNNSGFAQIALMDYLQNTRNKKAGVSLVKKLSVEFKDDIEVLERAAQLLWTFDLKEKAGLMFTHVCNLPPGEKEAFVAWSDSCLLSAVFALDDIGDINQGLLSINRYLENNIKIDKEVGYAMSIKEKINQRIK